MALGRCSAALQSSSAAVVPFDTRSALGSHGNKSADYKYYLGSPQSGDVDPRGSATTGVPKYSSPCALLVYLVEGLLGTRFHTNHKGYP